MTTEIVKRALGLLKKAEDSDLSKGQGDSKDFPTQNQTGPAEQGTTSDANGASESDFNKACKMMKGMYEKDNSMSKDDMCKAVKEKMDKMSDEDLDKAYKKMCDDMKKGEEHSEEKMEDKMEDKEKMEKALSPVELLQKEIEEKTLQMEELRKAEEAEFEKANPGLKKVTDLVKGLQITTDEKFDAVGTVSEALQKSFDTHFESLNEKIGGLIERLEQVESQGSRKSITSATPYLEKGEDLATPSLEGEKILSASNDKAAIVKAFNLDDALQKGHHALADEITAYESTGVLKPTMTAELTAKGYKVVA